MSRLQLLTLRLHAPLPFSGLENPPIGPAALFAPPSELPEGAEELFVFPQDGLVVYDPEDGPKAARELPLPGFHGLGGRGAAAKGSSWAIQPGTYLFMQYRPTGEADFLEGVEWFAREAWWEGEKARGPWLIRRLREDGKIATQILRSVEARQA